MVINRKTTRTATASAAPASVERIGQTILLIRGHKVLLDSDLAALYDVETKVFLQSVRRNLERFPEDFMMQLTPGGMGFFKVTICDLKNRGQGTTQKVLALRLY